MEIHQQIENIRANALLVSEVHKEQGEAWKRAKNQAIELAETIYNVAGFTPAVPPEEWNWKGRLLLRQVMSACNDVLGEELEPDTQKLIESTKSILEGLISNGRR